PARTEAEVQIITDEPKGHFLLCDVGWEKDRWMYASFVHIDVKNDGKVWLQHDGTDLRIAEWLVQKGIPKSDIVLGFHAPSQRPHIPEFAVA
ncbi:MAG: XisI protein, partial [Saprospiraceae bacterium]